MILVDVQRLLEFLHTNQKFLNMPQSENQTWKMSFIGFVFAILIAGPLWAWWQRPSVIETANLPVLKLLTTAVSQKNPERFAKVKVLLDQKLQSGELSSKEAAAFAPILQLAEEQKWDEARAECNRLSLAQLNRTRKPVDAEDHSHSHNHEHGHE